MALIPPGQEDAKLRRRLDRLFAKLERTYPDKVVVGLNADHPHWGEQVTELYRLLGYPDSRTFLAAYGFTLGSKPTGRPSVDHEAILSELKRRYADAPCEDLQRLKEENPDLALRFKSLQNKANELFGATFVAYLTEQGVLAGRKTRSDKGAAKEPSPAPEPEPVPEPEPAPELEPVPAADPLAGVPEGARPLLLALLSELNAAYPDKTVVQSRWNHARWDRPAGRLCQALGYRSGTDFLNAFGYRVVP